VGSAIIDAIAPKGDEIVLPKTSSSVFNSTNLDYLLRNIGIEDVLVAGFMTDQCIDHTVKDGADLGYYMSCVHDDRPEGRLHQIGMSPANALLLARGQLERRESLAAHMARDVAGPDENQLFPQHAILSPCPIRSITA